MSILIGGTHSGCGKSTITLGVLAALKARGLAVQPFKAGPDFIDPGLHSMVAGRISRNLDLWMCGHDYVREALARHSHGADAAVIEGVMGLYDGAKRSSAALAAAIGANIILVVDACGMAESAGAIVTGFDSYGASIKGVIFNRVASPAHHARLSASVQGVEVLGYLPREVGFAIPERHLGLHVAEDIPISPEALRMLGDAVTAHIDIARLAELARPGAALPPLDMPSPVMRIAVARDRAFCFYYEDNLDLLRHAGAELVYFSPLNDASLPANIDAVYIGGGYPELHAPKLSSNRAMREQLRAWVHEGRPLYAECGGLMYMGRGIDGHAMVGAFPYTCRMLERRAALGYREVSLAGATLRGHEFHYSEISEPADGVKYNVMTEASDKPSSAIFKRSLVSYTHVHLGSRPDAAGRIIKYIQRKT